MRELGAKFKPFYLKNNKPAKFSEEANLSTG